MFNDNISRLQEVLKAALEGDFVKFKALADVDVSVLKACNKRGSNTLHLAAANNHMDIARYIIKADPSLLITTNSSQRIPCDLANDDEMKVYLERKTKEYQTVGEAAYIR